MEWDTCKATLICSVGIRGLKKVLDKWCGSRHSGHRELVATKDSLLGKVIGQGRLNLHSRPFLFVTKKKELRDMRFAHEYVIDLNATRAAIAAGYSRKGARRAGTRLSTNVHVKALIAELTKKSADVLDLKAENVLRELQLMGFSNMLDYTQVHNGELVHDFSKLTREQAAAIQEITVEEYTEGRGKDARDIKKTRFKLSDKRGSLELLGKHLKLFNERLDIGNADDKPFQILVQDVGRVHNSKSD